MAVYPVANISSRPSATSTSTGVPAPLPSIIPIGKPPATTLSGLAAEMTSSVMKPALSVPRRRLVAWGWRVSWAGVIVGFSVSMVRRNACRAPTRAAGREKEGRAPECRPPTGAV